MNALEIAYPSPKELAVTLHGASKASESNSSTASYRQRISIPSDDLVRSVYELESVLAGEPASLLRVADWQKQIRTRPREDGSVALEVLDVDGEPELTTVTSREDVCDAILDGARSYLEQVCEQANGETPECHCLELRVGIKDIEGRLRYHREHGTQQGYEPTIEIESLEQFARKCVDNDRLRDHFAVATEIKRLTQRLVEQSDDEKVSACYRNLIEYHEELRAPTIEALVANPDERARSPLQAVLWSDVRSESRALRALRAIPNQQVVEDAAHILYRYSSDPDAESVCLEAAALLQVVDVESHLDRPAIDSLTSKLETAREEAATDDLSEALESLNNSRSE
ncbi:hypothetical protein [Halomicrobium salinisoli]|uniref:hypothetical protein n=1 Tax=Halomicrobium salinisoli TaxID=2878391 RepID=UPI001CF00115|nr:hypothetical protein [Halomicrobium salinisoli]